MLRLYFFTLNAWTIVLGVCLFSCREKPPETTSPATAVSSKPQGVDVELSGEALEAAGVVIATPRKITRRSEISAAGILEFVPSRVARISPIVNGHVTSIRVEPGLDVTKGALLATIISPDVGRARADYLTSKVKLMQAQAELERQTTLSQGKATSDHTLLAAKTEQALAQLSVRAASERLLAYGVGTQGLDVNEAKSTLFASQLALTTPIAGTVLEQHVRIGQSVAYNDTLFVIGDISEVWLTVDVYERNLRYIHIGDEARVSLVAVPNRVFVGRIDHLGTLVDTTRHVLPIRIILKNDDKALRPGMNATARLQTASMLSQPLDGGLALPDATNNEILVLPHAAVQTIDSASYVFVERKKGQYEMRAIERGATIENEIEITKGISLTDRCVVQGTFVLKSEVLREQMGKND